MQARTFSFSYGDNLRLYNLKLLAAKETRAISNEWPCTDVFDYIQISIPVRLEI